MAGNVLGGLLDLVAALDAARTGHHHHLIAANGDITHSNYSATGAEMPAREFVRRDDAVALLHAFHDLELHRIEILDGANAAEHRMQYPGGPVHSETHRDQP